MPCKILVAHTAGTVGKSTMVASLLYPRLSPSPKVISVESLGRDSSRYGVPRDVRYATNFPDIMTCVISAESHVIVDVGVSEFGEFLEGLHNYPGSISDYDVVLVIANPNERLQLDTIDTIEMLAEVGMQPHQLRVLFNKTPRRTLRRGGVEFAAHFRALLAYQNERPEYQIDPSACVLEAPVYTELAAHALSIQDVLDDPTDYLELVNEAVATNKPDNEILHFTRMVGLKRAAQSVRANLDEAFLALRLPNLETKNA